MKTATVQIGPPDESWDESVSALGANILQSREWALFQQTLGRQPIFASGDNWAWLAFERRGRGVHYLYAPYGPTLHSRAALEPAVASLLQAAKELKVDFIRLEPVGDVNGNDIKTVARKTRDFNPRRTLILNLTQSEAELRSALSHTTRNLINTAEQRQIKISRTQAPTAEQIDTFLAMLHETTGRDNFRAFNDEYYRQGLKVLGSAKVATLYSAAVNDATVAAAVVWDFQGSRYYAQAASFGQLNRQYKASAPLLWQTIMDAKNQGLKSFDLWGIAPTDDPKEPQAGVTYFKRSFGGKEREYVGTWEIPLRTIKYRAYRLAKRWL